MDFLFGLLFEIIVEGSLETVAHKKVPLVLRIIAGILVFAFYGGLVGFCFYLGIRDSQPVPVIIGIFILLLTVLAVYKKFKENRTR